MLAQVKRSIIQLDIDNYTTSIQILNTRLSLNPGYETQVRLYRKVALDKALRQLQIVLYTRASATARNEMSIWVIIYVKRRITQNVVNFNSHGVFQTAACYYHCSRYTKSIPKGVRF